MHKQVFTPGFLIFLLFIFSKMDLEQTVKDLQAQNSQFQQLLMTLAKGQEDLKALLEKEKDKEKKKKRTGVATMGRRFESHARKSSRVPLDV